MVARLEERLVGVERAEVFAAERRHPVILEEVAVVFAERAVDELGLNLLDQRVDTLVLVVDEETAERFARRRHADAVEERHRDLLAHHRRILQQVVEHERREPGEALIAGVAVEVDAQPELDAVARAGAARPDADVAHPLAAPDHVGGVVGVLGEVRAQQLQILRVDQQADLVQRRRVEDLVGRLRGGRPRRRGRREGERDRADEEAALHHHLRCSIGTGGRGSRRSVERAAVPAPGCRSTRG